MTIPCIFADPRTIRKVYGATPPEAFTVYLLFTGRLMTEEGMVSLVTTITLISFCTLLLSIMVIVTGPSLEEAL